MSEKKGGILFHTLEYETFMMVLGLPSVQTTSHNQQL